MNSAILNSILIKSEDKVTHNMRVCRGCLEADMYLYDIGEKNMELVFEELTGLTVSSVMLCCVCLRLINKFNVFRRRCRKADAVLQLLLTGNKNEITSKDRQDLKHSLGKTKTVFNDFIASAKNSNIDSTDALHVASEFNVLLTKNLDVKTKLEEDNDCSPLVGEFISKDDIDVGSIKEDMYTEPEFVDHHEENDFLWSDDDNKLLIEQATLPKKKHKKKKADVKKNKVKKRDRKGSHKEKKVKIEKKPTLEETENEIEKSNKKVQPEDLVLSTKIAATLRGIWKKNKNRDINKLFERIYMESTSVKLDESSSKTTSGKSSRESLSEDDISTKKKIRNFLDLVRKLSELYNVETEFVRLEDLQKEMEEKRNTGKYNVAEHGCELCCKQYNFLDTYERHMTRNHNNSWNIECEICRYRFKTQRDFLSHMMMHARIIKCRECGVSIPSKWCNAKKHAETHRGIVHACSLCNQTFTRKKSLSMHTRARHREAMEAVMCLLCGDTYNGDEGLKIHIRCIHKQAVQCGWCAVWFANEPARAAHPAPGCRLHSSCPVCGATFPNADLMLAHHKEQHPMYKCAQCKTTFDSKKTCIHFKYNHNVVKGKTKFEQKKRVRFYNKDIICEVCGKNNFTCVATLKIHQRIHTGERPFQCDICQKTFRMRSDLKLHTAIHTGERSYKCPYCPRTFRQPPHLKSHLPTHTKEKAHVCEICHKRFTQRANMQEHVRTIHEGLPPKRRQRHSKIFEA